MIKSNKYGPRTLLNLQNKFKDQKHPSLVSQLFLNQLVQKSIRAQHLEYIFYIITEISMESLDYTVDYGSAFALKCELVGISNATSVFWQVKAPNYKAKRIHIDNSKYFGSTIRSPSLVIADAKEYDEGSYYCTVKTNEENKLIKGNQVAVHVRGR